MAPTKQTKPKEMFKPYDTADIPAVMPFLELALVAATKGQETAVPKLNDHQQSWIQDVALRSVDLPSLKGKACTEFYDRVKTDAFNAKAFQHTPRDEDVAEEARVPALSKKNENKKNGNRKSDKNNDDDASDQEEDEAGRSGLLRGYNISGWRRATQKVISNKQTAENSKLKHKNDDNRKAEAPAMAKLLGLATYTGRDKFRDDHRDLILEHAKALPSTINTGSKFRKAGGMLWAQEDQAAWDIAAATEEGVDWKERQTLVASGFKTMVDKLHASGKFCPFVATMLIGAVRRGRNEKRPRNATETPPELFLQVVSGRFSTKINPRETTSETTSETALETTPETSKRPTLTDPNELGGQRRKAAARVDTRLKREAEEARRMVEVEEARQMVEAEKACQMVEVEEGHQMVEAEQVRQREEEEQARRSGEGEQGKGGPAPAPKKRGIKRKANTQLVLEEVPEEGMARQTGRTRQTPEEAKLERQKKLAATVGTGKVKPRCAKVKMSQKLSSAGTQVYAQDLSLSGTQVCGQKNEELKLGGT
ncbi:hypothetical protein K438DRAFT_1780354 [Mycena galopus ATCC 62051]|nr:hypothetical protein K438DRAFT_1780354 [Mycena galopus ATCC 62051]